MLVMRDCGQVESCLLHGIVKKHEWCALVRCTLKAKLIAVLNSMVGVAVPSTLPMKVAVYQWLNHAAWKHIWRIYRL